MIENEHSVFGDNKTKCFFMKSEFYSWNRSKCQKGLNISKRIEPYYRTLSDSDCMTVDNINMKKKIAICLIHMFFCSCGSTTPIHSRLKYTHVFHGSNVHFISLCNFDGKKCFWEGVHYTPFEFKSHKKKFHKLNYTHAFIYSLLK